jgi:hypothetical protein
MVEWAVGRWRVLTSPLRLATVTLFPLAVTGCEIFSVKVF